jgi:hypothetical protein
MRKDIRPIRGKQVSATPTFVPNPIRPECIRVTKVYDWVVTTNRDRNKVPVPEPCFTEIENCRHSGNAVTASCEEIPGARGFDVISTTPATNTGVPGAVVATIAFHTTIRIQFFCNGAPLCDFPVPVSFVDDFLLCNPTGTTIVPNIFDVRCSVLLNQMLGNMLVIDVIMCKEVQVEAEVKLEVEAKFCGPRELIPPPPLEASCPPILFPEQCPSFFPVQNCSCHAAVDFTGNTTTGVAVTSVPIGPRIVPGFLDFAALICDQCDVANSSLLVQFTEEPVGSTTPGTLVNDSFTFTSTEFNQPVCIDALSLTVTGRGLLTVDGGTPTLADFSLVVTGATAILTITGGNPPETITVTLSPATTPGFLSEIGPCSTFPM